MKRFLVGVSIGYLGVAWVSTLIASADVITTLCETNPSRPKLAENDERYIAKMVNFTKLLKSKF